RAQAYLEQGQALIARGEMAAAATVLREALRREPDLIQARASLGLALYGMGDLDAAVDELRAALRRQPDAVTARLTLATALVAKQDWAAARIELEQILNERPDLRQAHYSLGVVRYALGDLNGAIEAYRGVLAGDPPPGRGGAGPARVGRSPGRRASVSGLPNCALERLSEPRGERRRHVGWRAAPAWTRTRSGAGADPRGLRAERAGAAPARDPLRAGHRRTAARARRADSRLLQPRGRRGSARARPLGAPRSSGAPRFPATHSWPR